MAVWDGDNGSGTLFVGPYQRGNRLRRMELELIWEFPDTQAETLAKLQKTINRGGWGGVREIDNIVGF